MENKVKLQTLKKMGIVTLDDDMRRMLEREYGLLNMPTFAIKPFCLHEYWITYDENPMSDDAIYERLTDEDTGDTGYEDDELDGDDFEAIGSIIDGEFKSYIAIMALLEQGIDFDTTTESDIRRLQAMSKNMAQNFRAIAAWIESQYSSVDATYRYKYSGEYPFLEDTTD